MTVKEAIERLEVVLANCSSHIWEEGFTCEDCGENCHEAIDMAIKALEQHVQNERREKTMTVKEFKEFIEKRNLNDDTEIFAGKEGADIWGIRFNQNENYLTLYGAITEKVIFKNEKCDSCQIDYIEKKLPEIKKWLEEASDCMWDFEDRRENIDEALGELCMIDFHMKNKIKNV